MNRFEDRSPAAYPGRESEARPTVPGSVEVARSRRCQPSSRRLSHFSHSVAALLAGATLASAPLPALAAEVEPLPRSFKEQATDAFYIAMDIAVLRPGGLARLTIGSILMVPTTIFNVMGLPLGRDPAVFQEDAERYVLEPARFTFDRPVGKELAGY